MSLLIKALKKAEQSKDAKTEANPGSGGLTLELAPIEEEKPQENMPSLAEEAGLFSPEKPANASSVPTETMSLSETPKSEPPVTPAEPAISSTMPEDDIAAALMEESGFSLSDEAGFSEPPSAKTAKPVAATKTEKSPKPVKNPAQESAPERPAASTSTVAPTTSEQRSAAINLLTTRNDQKRSPGKRRSLYLGVAGLVVLLALGGGFYYYLQTLDQTQLVLMQPVPRSPILPATPAAAAGVPKAIPPPVVAQANPSPAVPAVPMAPPAEAAKPVDKPAQASTPVASDESMEQAVANKPAPMSKTTGAPKKSTAMRSMAMRRPAMADADSAMKVSRLNRGEPTTDPNLVAAYQAYQAGNDATAGQLYGKLLQNDPRNIDALLGAAAVAARQGHSDEAASDYQRALELDPNNEVAQEGLIVLSGQANPAESVSRLKSLIGQQPDAAHLHAALGGVYADQKQWPDAQQAYFKAFNLDPNNADYAFNLAVSLDQLKKPDLALNYYQQALTLLNKQGGSIDKTALENRINELRIATEK